GTRSCGSGPQSAALVAGQASGHDDDHGPLDHGGVVLREAFVVAGGASTSVDPGQGALHDPSTWQHGEADLAGQLGHDLHDQAEGQAVVDGRAAVAAVDPDHGDAGEAAGQGP